MTVQADSVRLTMADAGDGTPKWQLIFPLGEVRYRKDFPGGKVSFDSAFCESMAANYVAEGKPERAINFFHRGASTPGDVTPIDGKIAAGWIKDVRFDATGELGAGPGLYILATWTDRARGYIAADELRYLSPEFTMGAISKQTGKAQGPTLLGAALLNDPFLNELPAVAASENGDIMDRKMICAAMGLSETATDEQINAACQKMADTRAKLENPGAAAPEAEPAAVAEEEKKLSEQAEALTLAEASIVKLTEELTAAKATLAKADDDRKALEVKAFFDGLVREGKCIPAVREGLEKIALSNGLDAVKFLTALPATVAVNVELGVTGETGAADKLKQAQARWDAALARGKGMAAYEAAKVELAEDFQLLFGAELEVK